MIYTSHSHHPESTGRSKLILTYSASKENLHHINFTWNHWELHYQLNKNKASGGRFSKLPPTQETPCLRQSMMWWGATTFHISLISSTLHSQPTMVGWNGPFSYTFPEEQKYIKTAALIKILCRHLINRVDERLWDQEGTVLVEVQRLTQYYYQCYRTSSGQKCKMYLLCKYIHVQ